MPELARTLFSRAGRISIHATTEWQIDEVMISNGLGASRIGQALLPFLPGYDANFSNPMATTACLLSALIIIVGGWQIFSIPVGFQAELPAPSTEPHQILVAISNANKITIDGRATDLHRVYSDIAMVIKEHQRLGQSTRIALSADNDSTWNAALTVRDAAREAGDDDFAFGWRK